MRLTPDVVSKTPSVSLPTVQQKGMLNGVAPECVERARVGSEGWVGA